MFSKKMSVIKFMLQSFLLLIILVLFNNCNKEPDLFENITNGKYIGDAGYLECNDKILSGELLFKTSEPDFFDSNEEVTINLAEDGSIYSVKVGSDLIIPYDYAIDISQANISGSITLYVDNYIWDDLEDNLINVSDPTISKFDLNRE